MYGHAPLFTAEARSAQRSENRESASVPPVSFVASVVNESEIQRTALRSVRHPFQDTPLPTQGWRGIPAWNARHPSQGRAPTDPGIPHILPRCARHPSPDRAPTDPGIPHILPRCARHPSQGRAPTDPGIPHILPRCARHPSPDRAPTDPGIPHILPRCARHPSPDRASPDPGNAKSDLGNTKTAPRIIPLRANAMRGGAAGMERGPPSPQQALPAMSQRISHDESRNHGAPR